MVGDLTYMLLTNFDLDNSRACARTWHMELFMRDGN